MSWAPGDLALCVNDRKHGDERLKKIRAGCVYVVDGIGEAAEHELFGLSVPLYLKGVDDWFGHASERFIKITPPEADAFDHEIIDLMTGKPVPAEA